MPLAIAATRCCVRLVITNVTVSPVGGKGDFSRNKHAEQSSLSATMGHPEKAVDGFTLNSEEYLRKVCLCVAVECRWMHVDSERAEGTRTRKLYFTRIVV